MIHSTSRTAARTAAIARLLTLGATVVIASATSPISAADDPFDGAKMLADVQTYVDFGVHRTGTPGDIATRDWLVARFKSLGFDVGLEPFKVNQFLLDGASVVIDGRRYEAMPFWHPHQTGSKPIEGSIVFIQGNSVTAAVKGKIAVLGVDAAATPAMFARLASEGAIGVIVTSRVDVGVPVMENAQPPFVDRPTPLPAVIVANNAGEPLKAAASQGKAVSISVTGTEVPNVSAANVIATTTREASAPWIIVSTPYSGWNANAGERGPGIAILLALAERAARTPARVNYAFVVNSGHELDFLGAERSLESGRLPPSSRTSVWIHLGASIGVVRHTQQPDGKWVSDLNEIRTNIIGGTAFESEIRKAFADLPATSFSFGTALGEVANVQAKGYQVFGLINGGRPFPFFHTRLDQMSSVAAGHLAAVGRAAAAAVAAIESK